MYPPNGIIADIIETKQSSKVPVITITRIVQIIMLNPQAIQFTYLIRRFPHVKISHDNVYDKTISKVQTKSWITSSCSFASYPVMPEKSAPKMTINTAADMAKNRTFIFNFFLVFPKEFTYRFFKFFPKALSFFRLFRFIIRIQGKI